MAAPSIRVNGGTAGVKAAVSVSSAVTATLASTDGVRQCAWSVIGTDETSSVGSYTLVQSGSVGQNVAFTSLGAGTAMLLKVIVNAGINSQTGLADAAGTSATVKVYVPTASGAEVGAVGERYESDATFGATGLLNSAIRAVDAVSPGGIPIKIVKAATVAALPANTRSGNVLTADANGAFPTIGGSVTINPGDAFLVKDEGGGASHVNNGAYTLTTAGDGSNPWTATRATYWDASSELVKGTAFRVQDGTYEGQELIFKTASATINVTAQEFGTDGAAPATATYLCTTASALLSNEVAIDAIASTVTFASTTTTPLAASRTDAATNTTVDALKITSLSAGTAAAGFGVSCLFQGEFGGAAENYGRLGFTAADVGGGSEDTKAVVQTRTGGASLAACADFSGSGSTLYREDSSTNTTLNLLDLRRTTSGTAANSIGGSLSYTLEDSAGNADTAGTIAVDYLDATSTSEDARLLVRLQVAGSLTDVFSMRGATPRIDGLAGGGTRFVTVDNNGDVSATASAVSAPLTLTVDDATSNDVSTVLTLRHTNSGGNGAAGIGSRLVFEAEDAGGTAETAAYITGRFTTATDGAEVSEVGLWTRNAGALTKNFTLAGDGTVTLAALAGAATRLTTASTAGALGTVSGTAGIVTVASSGAPTVSNPAFLCNGAAPANVSNAVDITAASAALPFHCTGDIVAWFTRDNEDDNASVPVLYVRRTTNNTALAGFGGSILFALENGAGNTPDAAEIVVSLTDVTKGAEHGKIALYVISAGTPTERATLSSAGVWTTDGAMLSDGGFDRETAGAMPLAKVNATSVECGSASLTQVAFTLSGNTSAIDSRGVYDGPVLWPTALKTGTYAASAWDQVLCDPSGGGFTVTVPNGTTALKGKRVGIKNYSTSTNTITIDTVTTGDIQGGTATITTGWGYVELECIGGDGWIIVSRVT